MAMVSYLTHSPSWMEPVDQALTQLPLGHQKFSFINIVSGRRRERGRGGEGRGGDRVIGRLGLRRKEGDDGGRGEMGEKKEGLRQRCGGLLKHRVPNPHQSPPFLREGRRVEIILTMKLPPSSPLG
jgi:hypothetical protein